MKFNVLALLLAACLTGTVACTDGTSAPSDATVDCQPSSTSLELPPGGITSETMTAKVKNAKGEPMNNTQVYVKRGGSIAETLLFPAHSIDLGDPTTYDPSRALQQQQFGTSTDDIGQVQIDLLCTHLAAGVNTDCSVGFDIGPASSTCTITVTDATTGTGT